MLCLTFCNFNSAFNFLPEFCTSRFDSLSAANLNCDSLTQTSFGFFFFLCTSCNWKDLDSNPSMQKVLRTPFEMNQISQQRETPLQESQRFNVQQSKKNYHSTPTISWRTQQNTTLHLNHHTPPLFGQDHLAVSQTNWEKLWRISFPMGKVWESWRGSSLDVGTVVIGHEMST